MKKILLIGTGGTIASELSESGYEPELTSEQLLENVPLIKQWCDVDCIELFKIDSTNMAPYNWIEITGAIRENFDRYDGFVVTHGTDTMAYTAAGLSYLIQNSNKPIVLTGAQKPIGNDSTDSKVNLADAFLCASSNMPGVQIVFNGSVIIGTRAQKTHSKSYSAFSSINYPNLAVIQDGMLLRFIENSNEEDVCFYDKLCSNVCLIKLIPGLKIDILEYALQQYDAVVIESFGVGGLPNYGNDEFHECVRKYAGLGKLIVMTTQVANEGSDMGVYEVGHSLKKIPGVMEAYDMTSEAVVAKLMWILGQTRDSERAREMLYKPISHDILKCHEERIKVR